MLFDNLDFVLPKNGIVGVIGPNGAGKTTLFRMIMGKERVDKGSFEVGETVKIAYVDQTHEAIDPEKSIFQVIADGQETIKVGGVSLMPGLISADLILQAVIRRKSVKCFPEVREIAYILP